MPRIADSTVFKIAYKYIFYDFIIFNIGILLLCIFPKFEIVKLLPFGNVAAIIMFLIEKLILRIQINWEEKTVAITTWSMVQGKKEYQLNFNEIEIDYSDKLMGKGTFSKMLIIFNAHHRFVVNVLYSGWTREKIDALYSDLQKITSTQSM